MAAYGSAAAPGEIVRGNREQWRTLATTKPNLTLITSLLFALLYAAESLSKQDAGMAW